GDRADHADCDGEGASLRDPRGRPHGRRRRGHGDPAVGRASTGPGTRPGSGRGMRGSWADGSREDHPRLHAVPGEELSYDEGSAQAPAAFGAPQALPALQCPYDAPGDEVIRDGPRWPVARAVGAHADTE